MKLVNLTSVILEQKEFCFLIRNKDGGFALENFITVNKNYKQISPYQFENRSFCVYCLMIFSNNALYS